MTINDTRTEPSTAPLSEKSTLRRVVISGALGNFIEWYDMAVYAYAAVGISAMLFPDSGMPVVETFAVFAIAYLLRPISGVFMGTLGDRVGRKKLLVLTIVMMASATFLIGAIPNYATIGIGAPLLLLACRSVQGIAAGGEFVGASTYVYEHAPKERRAFLVGLLQLGTGLCYPAAAFFAFGLAHWIGDEAFVSWGWRILFVAAAPLGLIALYIRTKLQESPEFAELRESGKVAQKPFQESLRADPRRLLFAALFICGYAASSQGLLFFMPIYLVNVVELTPTQASLIMGFTTLAFAVAIPVFGWTVDRVSRNTARISSCVIYLVLIVPMYVLIGLDGTVALVLGLLGLALLQAFHYAIAPLTSIDVFPARLRYTSGTIAYNIPIAVMAAAIPPTGSYLVEATGNPLAPAFVVAAVTLVGVIGGIGLRRREREIGVRYDPDA